MGMLLPFCNTILIFWHYWSQTAGNKIKEQFALQMFSVMKNRQVNVSLLCTIKKWGETSQQNIDWSTISWSGTRYFWNTIAFIQHAWIAAFKYLVNIWKCLIRNLLSSIYFDWQKLLRLEDKFHFSLWLQYVRNWIFLHTEYSSYHWAMIIPNH